MKKNLLVLLVLPVFLFAVNTSRSMPISSRTDITPVIPFGTMLNEGFEAAFPPTGWDTTSVTGGTSGGSTPIPWHQSTGYNHTGTYGCAYGWGYSLNATIFMDGLDFSNADSISLSFWWESSFSWSVDPNDNCDLFVLVSTDGGTTYDTLWTFGDSTDVVNSGVNWPWGQFIWVKSTLNLDVYAGEVDVDICFNLVGDDNADVAIDDVQIDTISLLAVEENPIAMDLPFSVKAVSQLTNRPGVYFSTPTECNVNVEIIDLSGRCVANLYNGIIQGERTFYFDTEISGTYIYKVTANGATFTGKLISVK